MLIEGIDYAEKHAAQVRWTSLKIMLAIAVLHDWDIILWDIKTFFLYGRFHPDDPPVFMEQEEGWDAPETPRETHVALVNRTMYGHPASSNRADVELKTTILEDDIMTATASDDCVYVTKQHDDGFACIGSHVDDLPAVGDAKGLKKIETLLKRFNTTYQLNPDVITGVQLERKRGKDGWLKLHQGGYIAQMLKDYSMEDCKPTDTPLDPGTMRAVMELPVDKPDAIFKKKYQQLMGSFIWLLKTRNIDLGFTVNFFSRCLCCATESHYNILRNRPLRYLKGTIEDGIIFKAGDGDWKLTAYSDSDFSGDLKTAKSTTGYLLTLGELGTISGGSSLERKICTSTGQGETYAHVTMAKEVEWTREFLRELNHPVNATTISYCDNDGVVKQSKKPINHNRAKHYRVSQAYIREMNANNIIDTRTINTDDNPADILTKPLHAPKYIQHRRKVMGA